MEGIFILFIVFVVIISIAQSAKKQASKSQPPPRPYFPPLSVDAVPRNQAPTVAGTEWLDTEGVSFNESFKPGLNPVAPDLTEVKEDLSTIDEDLSELKVDIAPPLPAQTLDPALNSNLVVLHELGLFANHNEAVKAVIYSEIMYPKFRSH